MLLDIILLQPALVCSRPITSHHVTSHVTTVICLHIITPEWLASAEFTINNKVYLVTKVSLFIVNYNRELRMEADIKRKKKMKKWQWSL